MFLVGRGIPDHITSLPQTILNTPFGQMMKPQLDNAMRGITQAPVAPITTSKSAPNGSASVSVNGTSSGQSIETNGSRFPTGTVRYATTLKQLDALLESAKTNCAVIFFTSATCPPCKIVYPAYDELAAETTGKAVLIKVDLSEAYEIGSKYRVRATPTFMSFIKGEKEGEWVGANEAQLRGNIRMLVQMAHPPHPHTQLRLRTLQRHHRAVLFPKTPPLEKLVSKLGVRGNDPSVVSLKNFIIARETSGASDAPLPSLPKISGFMTDCMRNLPADNLFPAIDLLRCALADPRVSGFFLGETSTHLIVSILDKVELLAEECPYSLRIVTLHLACNTFSSLSLAIRLLQSKDFSNPLVQLVTSSLLDTSHPQARVAAASLAFNIAAVNHKHRLDDKPDILGPSAQIELMVSLLEAVSRESESKDGIKGLLTAIGLLSYGAPRSGEWADLCSGLEAKSTVAKKKALGDDFRDIVAEVEQVLA